MWCIFACSTTVRVLSIQFDRLITNVIEMLNVFQAVVNSLSVYHYLIYSITNYGNLSWKNGENGIKIDPYKPWHNTCWKYVPSNEQRWEHENNKTCKHRIFSSTADARCSISPPPKLCLVAEDVETILKGANRVSIQRIVFPTGCKMLIFSLRGDEIPAVAA